MAGNSKYQLRTWLHSQASVGLARTTQSRRARANQRPVREALLRGTRLGSLEAVSRRSQPSACGNSRRCALLVTRIRGGSPAFRGEYVECRWKGAIYFPDQRRSRAIGGNSRAQGDLVLPVQEAFKVGALWLGVRASVPCPARKTSDGMGLADANPRSAFGARVVSPQCLFQLISCCAKSRIDRI